MGIELRVAELGGDALLKALGDEVLEALSLLVHFVPRVIEHAHQEGFEQAVVANDLKRAPFAILRETNAVMLAVKHKRRLGSS